MFFIKCNKYIAYAILNDVQINIHNFKVNMNMYV